MVLSPLQPNFKSFEGYRFTQFDQSQLQTQTEELKEIRTNAKGEAEFDLSLERYSAPYFSVRFDAEGFEADGGRGVKASSSVILSTLDFMIGAKPDGDLDYIHKGSERNVHLIAIDSDLKKIAASELTAQVVERKYISVLTQSDSGAYKYQSVLKEIPAEAAALKVDANGINYAIKTDLPGDFFLIVKNKEGVELLKLPYTVAGEANLARSLDRNSELQLLLNKKDFKIGEEIELQIKAPYKGAGLISIERDGVYQYKWFKTESSATVQKIKVPEGLSGNAYVHVTLLRAIDSKEIFMSPLSYAVAPFSISLDDHKTIIKLDAPEKVKPGETLKIKYSANQPTNIILYGVDEGILQVAKYKLPDPLGFFFQKRALQVKTYQMLDLIMPEYNLIQQGQAPGGDEGYGAIGKNLNPFRSKRSAPIAFWSGVISAGPNQKTYSYKVPDYFNGNIKIMAVAASAKNLGSTELSAFVRGDFIITPSTPVFVAPLDEMVIGVSVSNQKEKSGQNAAVTLTAKTNALLEISKNAEQSLTINEGQEVATNFSIKAKDNVGEGQITFEAKHEKTIVRAVSDISVRPVTPYQNLIQASWSDKAQIELTESTPFYEPYAKKIFSVSASPIALNFGLQNFLENQPYGCTEQVVSRALPSVVLRDFFTKNKKQDEKFNESVKSLIRILRTRQMPDGGFSLYENFGGQSHPAASLHAILALIEIRDRRMGDVNDMLQKAKTYLSSAQVTPTSVTLDDYRFWAQALYLSARMKIVNGSSLTALKKELSQNFKEGWQQDVAGLFVASTYRLYKQDDQSEAIFKNYKFNKKQESLGYSQFNYFHDLSEEAVSVYLAALHAGESYDKLVITDTLNPLTTNLGNRLNTFGAAYLLLAFEAIEQRNSSAPIKANLKAAIKNVWTDVAPQQTGKMSLWNVPLAADKVQLKAESASSFFYVYQNSGFASDEKLAKAKNGIEVNRQYSVNGKAVSEIKIGEEVDVTLAIRSTDELSHDQIAIVDLLPGGFELIQQKGLNRLDSGGSDSEGYEENDPEYQPVEPTEPEESEEGAYLKWPISLIIPTAYAQTTTTEGKAIYSDYIDQRDDRIVIYATVTPEVQYFKYKIKAVAEGKFKIPPAFAEGMYDRGLRFVGASGWFTIKSAK